MTVPAFVGRQGEIASLDLLLAEDGEATPVVICAVSGTAGVGKTALAVHWAHRVRASFPDGQLYINLRGFEASASPVQPGEAIRVFLDALAVPTHRIPVGLAEQVGLYRSLVADRRILVVLDNAGDSEQVRPLLPGGDAARVIITSRNRLLGLVAAEGARPLPLGTMDAGEANELLRHGWAADELTGNRRRRRRSSSDAAASLSPWRWSPQGSRPIHASRSRSSPWSYRAGSRRSTR
jgi:hypothetical protein